MSKQQQQPCQWWFEEEEEQSAEESITTKFKPVSIVSEKPSAEQVAQLAPGEYIAWQKASGFIEACVQASSVDNDRIEFECPFCSQYRNKNGTRKCQPVRRMHAHGSLGDRTQRVEDRGAHCTTAAVGSMAGGYGFQIYITENTKGAAGKRRKPNN